MDFTKLFGDVQFSIISQTTLFWVSNIAFSIITAFIIYILLIIICRALISSITSGIIKRSKEKLSEGTSKTHLLGKTGKIPRVQSSLSDLADETEIKKRQTTLFRFCRLTLRICVLMILLFRIIMLCGIDIAPLFAGAGIIGVALGFGAQNIVKDCCAGFFIILENQIRMGDFIEIDAVGMLRAKGTVEKLTLRQTALRDREGDVHFISNGSIIQVINRTLGFSKALFSFNVYFTEDFSKLIEIINSVGEKMLEDKSMKKLIHEPMHFKELGEILDNRVEVYVVGSTKPGEQWLILDVFKRELLKELRSQKIDLPN